MDQWRGLLEAAGERLGPYAPRVLGGLAILLLAWLFAWLVRSAVLRLAASRGLDVRLQTPGLGALLASIGSALVWLFALPALLDSFGLQGLLAPVNAMMARLLGILPAFLGAAAIFGIGLLAARIISQIVSGLLTAAGSERLAERIGLNTALGEKTLAGTVGSVVFALILLPTLTAALQTLGLDIIAAPVGHLLDQIFELIPKLIAAAVIVTIGAVLGRLLAGLVSALLTGVGLNKLPERLGMAPDLRVGGRTMAELAGGVVMATALLLAIMQACEVLGFTALTEAVAMLGSVLARLLVALIVIAVGLWLGTVASRVIAASAVANAALLGRLVRGAILFFTVALALRQAGLPADIVTIAFGAVIIGAALAVAIAVGNGGREVAARLLEKAAASFEGKRDIGDGGTG